MSEANNKGPGVRYGLRNQLLRRLGYPTYEDYLAGDRWRDVKAAVLAAEPACVVCGAEPYTVHHCKYTEATLLSRKGHPALVPVCRRCHQAIEMDAGRKVGVYEALTRLLCLMTKAGRYQRADAVARACGRKYTPAWYSGSYADAAEGVRDRGAGGKKKWKGWNGRRRGK